MKRIKIEVISKVDKEFINKWQELWDQSEYSNFFNSPLWFSACVETFSYSEFYIFCARCGKKLIAVFPLVKTKKFGFDLLASPGGDGLDKSTLLIKEGYEKLLEKLVKKMKTYTNFHLAELPEELALKINSKSPNVFRIFSSRNPFLPLDGDPLKYMHKKQRNKIINKYKKNEKYLRFAHHIKDHEIHLNEVFEIDKDSSKKFKGLNTFSDSKDGIKLFREIIKQSPNQVSIDISYFKDEPIVYSLDYIANKTCYGMTTAYKEEFHSLNPGKLELYFLFKELKRKGIEIYDFSRGENILKKEFTPLGVNQYDIYFSANLFVIFWWKLAVSTISFLKNNESIYGSICLIRKYFILIKSLRLFRNSLAFKNQ